MYPGKVQIKHQISRLLISGMTLSSIAACSATIGCTLSLALPIKNLDLSLQLGMFSMGISVSLDGSTLRSAIPYQARAQTPEKHCSA